MSSGELHMSEMDELSLLLPITQPEQTLDSQRLSTDQLDSVLTLFDIPPSSILVLDDVWGTCILHDECGWSAKISDFSDEQITHCPSCYSTLLITTTSMNPYYELP